MSTTIQIKRSSTASAIPVTGDIAVGELAVNLADKRLFTKQSDGTIIELSTNPTDLDAATLRIDGVEITASATELNSLDGFTGSTTELNILDGLTATTIELNTLDGITASTAELNKLDGYTGSTAELNILDGVTATTAEINTLDGFTGSASDLNYAKDLRATGVTTAEFDKLDGLTATTTELNITDGLTATTAELNTLDGITASTLELNYTDGVTSNIQTQLDAMVEKSGDTMTGDLSLGDNNKATFGTGNDLQIYHDGSDSIIVDNGTGDLLLRGSNSIRLQSHTGETYFKGDLDGASKIYHNNAEKLATTSTGVDVTGTVTADGLTVDGNGLFKSLQPKIILEDTSISGADKLVIQSAVGQVDGDYDFVRNNDLTLNTDYKTMTLKGNGDVSFYEDTGTTAKMVWSSNKEQLQITSANTGASGWTENVYLKASQYPSLRFWETTGGKVASIGNNGDGSMVISVNGTTGSVGTNAITVDSAGNVGIGTASPNKPLTVKGEIRSEYLLSNAQSYWGTASDKVYFGTAETYPIAFETNGTERARIDSSGNLLVGTTDSVVYNNTTGEGINLRSEGRIYLASNDFAPVIANRIGTDGDIAQFRKDGSTVGSIGTASSGDLYIADGRNAGVRFDGGNNQIAPCTSSGSNLDATLDLGVSGARFKDLYLSGGVYLGGTGAANKLDDYEEGVWTPRLEQSSTNPSVTYSSQSGTYTKVGRVVYASGHIAWSSQSGGSGAFKLAGLPFNVLNSSGSYPQLLCTDYGGIPFGVNDTTFGGYGAVGTSRIQLTVVKNNGSGAAAVSTLNSSGYMYFNLTYQE